MKRLTTALTTFVFLATAFGAAASAATITVTVSLPNGSPAKHTFVRMTTMGAHYQIVSLETETTSASGTATFKFRSGACLKAEYGTGQNGRPVYIGHICPKSPGRATIELSR